MCFFFFLKISNFRGKNLPYSPNRHVTKKMPQYFYVCTYGEWGDFTAITFVAESLSNNRPSTNPLLWRCILVSVMIHSSLRCLALKWWWELVLKPCDICKLLVWLFDLICHCCLCPLMFVIPSPACWFVLLEPTRCAGFTQQSFWFDVYQR